MSKKRIWICPEHNVEMKKAKIVYGLVPPGAYEKELEAGKIILGGCIVDELGKYGFVCPVDKEPYVMVSGHLTKYSEL